MRAEMTFRRGVRFRININRVVRTRLQTRFAADALLRVEFDNTICALIHRRRRTDVNAGRIFALIAARHLEMAARVGELTLFDVLDPGAENAEGNLIFFFARNTAGMATDALAIVDNLCVFHLLLSVDVCHF